MTEKLQAFKREYAAALYRYLADSSEAALQMAYELGRRAMAEELGVLDVVQLHNEVASDGGRSSAGAKQSHTAGAFLVECLSPFEMTHRGFREANAVLRRSEARYRSLVDNAPLGICRCSLDGRFLSANPALVRMLGYESEAELLQADPAASIYPHPDPGEPRRAIAQFLLQPDLPKVAELEWRRKDNQPVIVRLTGRAVLNEQGAVDCAELMGEDVTERVKLEAELRQSQKMEAIGQLAGGVAHDFNNFITGILLCNHILARGLEPGDPRWTQVEEIEYVAGRAALLTQQLLAFGRRQVIQPRMLDLNRVIGNISKLLTPLLGADVVLEKRLHPQPCYVLGDWGQLEQVVVNLAINARDAMPDGGKVVITTSAVELGPSELAARGLELKPGSHVSLTVSDEGVGMSTETLARVFEPFFTTKEPGKGTGLGLATVYAIVAQSGGAMHVDSAPGKGSTFTILIPRVEAPAGEPGEAQEPDDALHGSETILLVEDDRTVRHAAKATLEDFGYTVVAAGTTDEALEIIHRPARQAVDLLIADVVLPTLGGQRLADRFLETRPDARVLYISGYPDETVASRGALVTDRAYLQKPFTPARLAAKVREVLDR